MIRNSFHEKQSRKLPEYFQLRNKMLALVLKINQTRL